MITSRQETSRGTRGINYLADAACPLALPAVYQLLDKRRRSRGNDKGFSSRASDLGKCSVVDVKRVNAVGKHSGLVGHGY